MKLNMCCLSELKCIVAITDSHIIYGCIELGSGCGYVGICVAAMEQVQKVTLTDRLM